MPRDGKNKFYRELKLSDEIRRLIRLYRQVKYEVQKETYDNPRETQERKS